jgi:hypothetical protein
MWAAVASVVLCPPFLMLVAFVVTFLATRFVTHMIRDGRGPFRDNTMGGVHVHHEVYGIFLLLVAGALEFAYQPDPPGPQILATLFGVGAALTLDEFALWLHLDDVYWGPEGRRSVDAVLVAVIVGGLMLVVAAPWDVDASDGETVAGITIGVNLLFIVIALFKGRIILGILGFMVPLLAFVAAMRLARPRSPWARRFYGPGTRRRRRSERRFPAGRRHRWEKVVDMFAGSPALPAPARPAAVTAPHSPLVGSAHPAVVDVAPTKVTDDPVSERTVDTAPARSADRAERGSAVSERSERTVDTAPARSADRA